MKTYFRNRVATERSWRNLWLKVYFVNTGGTWLVCSSRRDAALELARKLSRLIEQRAYEDDRKPWNGANYHNWVGRTIDRFEHALRNV